LGSFVFATKGESTMNKPQLKPIIESVKTTIVKRSPEILIGIGLAGMITTTVLAVQATPKALALIEEEKKRKNEDSLSVKDAVRVAWKCYIPAAVTGATSAACIIGASSVHTKRNTALATAYKLSETALTEYKEKVIETIGETKEKNIKEKIAKDKVEKAAANPQNVIVTGGGDTQCYDLMFGRLFESDIDSLNRIVNDLNRRMRDEITISLNDFFTEVGLDEVEGGYDLTWDIDDSYIELDISAHLVNGKPCLAVGFVNPPKYRRGY
jgi:hypothetical protein